jgi:hypothetical protein
MLRCIHVGLLCIQDDPQHRPGMASVVLRAGLEGGQAGRPSWAHRTEGTENK